MKPTIVLISTLLFLSQVRAQVLWIEAEAHSKETILMDRVTQSTLQPTAVSNRTINYHPAFTFNLPYDINLKKASLNNCQVFSVYQADSKSREEMVWAFSKSEEDQLLMTDRRVVDLNRGKFMNFLDQDFAAPKINVYQHALQDFETEIIRFGQRPYNEQIPVQSFRGSLATLILFDGVLTSEARHHLETALAIKYSVPLAPEFDYISQNGSMLLDCNKSGTFIYNIAGLGRSDDLHLYQKQSKSKFGEGFISIGLGGLFDLNAKNPSNIEEATYLLWSDDHAEIDFEELEFHPPVLKRRWKFFNHHMTDQRKAVVLLKHAGIQQELKENEYLWLAIRGNGDNGFSDYHLLTKTENENRSGLIDLSIKDKSVFSFVKAPAFWIKTEVVQPNCASNTSGYIELIPIGGKGPFAFEVQRENEGLLALESEERQVLHNLEAGMYRVKVTDNEGQTWETDLQLNPDDLEVKHLKANYYLSLGDLTSIDLGQDNQANYEWTLPDGAKSYTPQIELSQSGQYLLEINKNHCSWKKSFEVHALANSITRFSITPNPTYNNYIALSATLEKSMPYQIFIYSIDGRLLFKQAFSKSKFIHYRHQLPNSGTFIITLKAGQSSQSEQVIALNP